MTRTEGSKNSRNSLNAANEQNSSNHASFSTHNNANNSNNFNTNSPNASTNSSSNSAPPTDATNSTNPTTTISDSNLDVPHPIRVHPGHLPLDMTLPEPPERHIPKSLITVLSGGLAGMVAKTLTAPLERVQMLNQTGATQLSIKKTIETILERNGVRGLWRGNLANCVRVFPHKSILFTCNDVFRAKLSNFMHSESSYLNFATGAAAGLVATTATYPIDVVRAYLAGTFDSEQKSMYRVTKKIIRVQGVKGLYAGLGVTLVGAVPYEAARIGVYNVLRPQIPTVPTNYGEEPHPLGKFAVGACAGAVAGVLTYPTDTIRRMLQVQQADGMPKYSGLWDCISSNWRQKGIKRFYRGMTAKLVRVIPDAAILFVAYEQLKDYFEDVHYDFDYGKHDPHHGHH